MFLKKQGADEELSNEALKRSTSSCQGGHTEENVLKYCYNNSIYLTYFSMDSAARVIVKANEHYQLTIPAQMRSQMSIEQGTLFTVLQAEGGILFRPLKLQNGADVYAGEMDAEEVQEIKDAMMNIKTGHYTKIDTSSALKKHLDALKQ